MAYGSPDRPENIEQYYTHIRGGRKPSTEQLNNLQKRYEEIGGLSPLLHITQSTVSKLQARLGSEYSVYVGMKHWHPFVSETFNQIIKDKIEFLVAIALAPHFSKMSIGSYQDALKDANSSHANSLRLKLVDSWYKNPQFLKSWSSRVSHAIETKFQGEHANVFLLFTAHSLPEKIQNWGDPYKTQLLETADLIANDLHLKKEHQYSFAFQSAGHTSEPWLGPDILSKIRELKSSGVVRILVAPIGFVSDHLEILYDVDIEAKSLATRLGIQLERTDSFNDSDEFIEILAAVTNTA